jgi:hypothetical protein
MFSQPKKHCKQEKELPKGAATCKIEEEKKTHFSFINE